MVLVPIKCPHCGSENVRKNGTSQNGKQRYMCCNSSCPHKTFIENYTYNACAPDTRSRILFATVNGNGTRAIARMLGIAKDTVTETLRSVESLLWYVNYDYLEANKDSEFSVELVSADEVEMDEMWSFVHDKSHRYAVSLSLWNTRT